MEWTDGKPRCRWANPKNPAYIAYHDGEWGVPLHDDRALFELLILETFQAGLSWECVLNKRPAFRQAFEGFYPERVAAFDEAKREELAQNAAIIRNRRKISAAVKNAAVFLDIQREWGSFDAWLWHWTQGEPLIEYGPASSPLSDEIPKTSSAGACPSWAPRWSTPTCRRRGSSTPMSRGVFARREGPRSIFR